MAKRGSRDRCSAGNTRCAVPAPFAGGSGIFAVERGREINSAIAPMQVVVMLAFDEAQVILQGRDETGR